MPIRHIGIIAIITTIGIIDIGTGGNSYSGEIAMPWTAEDAERHTAETGDDGRAIREANATVARDYGKSA